MCHFRLLLNILKTRFFFFFSNTILIQDFFFSLYKLIYEQQIQKNFFKNYILLIKFTEIL